MARKKKKNHQPNMPPTKTHVCENLGPQPETGANEVLTFLPAYGKKKTVFSAPTQTKFEYLLFFKVHQIKIAQICLLPCLTRPANTHKCTRKSGNFLESQAILLQNPHKSTLLLFLVVWALVFFLSYHSFFLQHGCLFLAFFFVSCWFWFGVLLSVVVPIFCSTWTFLLCVSFWCVWWTNSVEA